MNDKKLGTILLVDDEEIIRSMLKSDLSATYEVFTAENASEAFNILDENKIDLCISDINMPGMKGFELIEKIQKDYHGVKTALITAYDVNDYIRMAKDQDVSNIIVKTTPFNFSEFNWVVRNLITENIFGLDKYMHTGYRVLQEYKISSSEEITEIEEDIISKISEFVKVEPYVNILLEELITNAVYHAPVDENGNEKYIKHSKVLLEKGEAVKIVLGKDHEKYGVSVMDPSGKLTKKQVLYRIDRHVHGEGLLDENGRGLHMSRIYSDRLVINIKKDVATETIFFNYLDKKYSGSKPLYINEI